MKKRKLAILSIGQRPCLKENDDMLTRLPEDIEIMQYGALDGLTLEEIERATIEQALSQYKGNLSQVASVLGISRAALYRRLEKYDIHV